ncbi:MAG TPA: sulfotransferase, partial [Acidimicrobiales bacterium]
MTMPDFIVIGAPKAGSTALHAALAGHPQLFLSPVKEPKFFLCDNTPPPRQTGPGDAHSRQEWIWRREDYEDLFRHAPPGTLVGESTPLYLQDLDAHDRIARLAPDARLIAVIRDPVDRAYSNWAHLWSDGLEPEADFLAACAAEDERQRRGWAPFWRYKGQGRYGEQLEHLYSVFPRD